MIMLPCFAHIVGDYGNHAHESGSLLRENTMADLVLAIICTWEAAAED